MKTGKIVSCLCAALVFVTAGSLRAELPSKEFVAAGLRSQDRVSLEVSYSRYLADVQMTLKNETARYRYIRTPEAMYISVEFTDPNYPASKQECSLDRSNWQLRELETYRDGQLNGIVRDEAIVGSGFLYSYGMLETSLLCVGSYPEDTRIASGFRPSLPDVIPYAQSMTEETIEGFSCLKIVLDKPETSTARTVWVDPNIGFCQRRVVYRQGNIDYTYDYKDYSEIASGIWFPMTVVKHSTKPNAGWGVMKVSKIEVKPAIPKDSLIIQFKSGTKVTVNNSVTIETP